MLQNKGRYLVIQEPKAKLQILWFAWNHLLVGAIICGLGIFLLSKTPLSMDWLIRIDVVLVACTAIAIFQNEDFGGTIASVVWKYIKYYSKPKRFRYIPENFND